MKPTITSSPTYTLPRVLFEKKIYNFLDIDGFSCVEYKQIKPRERYNIFATYYMCAIILCGQKHIYTEDGILKLNPGDGFFAQKGAYLFSDAVSAENNQFRSLIFFIKDNFLCDFLNSYSSLKKKIIAPVKYPEIFQIHGTSLLKSTVESILPYFSHDSTNTNNLLRLKASELLFHIIESDKNDQFLGFLREIHNSRKKNLKNLMEENYYQPLNLKEFARISGRSLTSFKKEFNNVFNQSPKRWVTRKRLERAHSLLATTDKNVTQVCFEVGFENLSYFTQIFKKNFGITPKRLQIDQNQQKNTFN